MKRNYFVANVEKKARYCIPSIRSVERLMIPVPIIPDPYVEYYDL